MAGKSQRAAKHDRPREFRVIGGPQVTINAAGGEDSDGKPRLPTFTGTAYTGQPMRPMGWWNDVIIDLDGVKHRDAHPILRQHDHEQILGHGSVRVDSEGIHVEGIFSGQQQHVDKVVVPARNGFPWQMSVGADPVRTEFLEAGEEATVNGRTVKGPLLISRETKLAEVSFVPLGADGDTSANVAASKRGVTSRKGKGKSMSYYSDEEIDQMDEEEAKLALKKCMAEQDDDEDEDDDEDDRRSKSASGRRLVKATARREARRISALAKIDGEFSRLLNCRLESDCGTMSGLEEAVRKGWSPERFRRECMRLARSMGIAI